MAKIREKWTPLKTGYIDSKKVNRCSLAAETLFTRLVAACDDNSNFDGDPALLAYRLYAERMKSCVVSVTDLERMRNEIVTNRLVIRYEVDGEEYLHIPNNKKIFRADIKPDIRFPNIPQVIIDKWNTESVTDSLRTRYENVSTNPNPNTYTNTTTNPKSVPENTERIQDSQKANDLALNKNSHKSLALGLEIQNLINQEFGPFNDLEMTTFTNLFRHLSFWAAPRDNGDGLEKIKSWVRECKHRNVKKPKAMFVAKCKKETGFKKGGRIL